MKNISKVTIFYGLAALSAIMVSGQLCGQTVSEKPIRATLIGFADRWADYGSRGDMPGFRDFLAVLHQSNSDGNRQDAFIKLRFLYWGKGKSDPELLSRDVQKERVFEAKLDAQCDETFARLSHEGDVSYLDPQLKPSKFVHISGTLTKLPQAQATLQCFVVK